MAVTIARTLAAAARNRLADSRSSVNRDHRGKREAEHLVKTRDGSITAVTNRAGSCGVPDHLLTPLAHALCLG
jgi:hypothetical protein